MSKPWDQDYGSDKEQAPWDRKYGGTAPAPKKPGYGVAAALADVGVSGLQGAAGLAGAGAALVDSATGGAASRALAPAERLVRGLSGGAPEARGLVQSANDVSAALQPLKSERLQQSEQELADTEGFFPSAKKVLTDPALLLGQAGQQLPIIAATAVGARAGARAGAARAQESVAARLARGGDAPSAGAAERLTRMASQRGATEGVLGTTAAMGGGFSAQQAMSDALALPDEVWAQDPEYVQMVADGMAPDEAKQARAYAAGRAAAPIGAGVNLLAGRLTAGIEAKALTGKVSPGGVSGLFSGEGARRVGGAVGREALEETATEGIETFGGNYGTSQIDPNQDLMEGVPEASGAAAVMGGVMGGGMQVAGTLASRGEQAAPAQGESAASEALAAAPPVPTQQEVVDIDPAAGPLSKAVATDAAIQAGSPTVEPVRITTPVASAADMQAAEQAAAETKPADVAENATTPAVKESLTAAPQNQGNVVANPLPSNELSRLQGLPGNVITQVLDGKMTVEEALKSELPSQPMGMDPETGEVPAPANDEQIRLALKARAGGVIDIQAIRAIATAMGVPVARVAQLKRDMRAEERQPSTTAATAASTQQESTNVDEKRAVDGRARSGDRQKQFPAPVADGAEARQQEGQRQEGQGQEKGRIQENAGSVRVDGRQESPRQEEARKYAADDARGADGGRVSVDETPEQQDGDIMPPSGNPFSIRGAADMAARRHPGSKVIELEDGGFVVRTPKEVSREAADPKSASSVEPRVAAVQEVRPAMPAAAGPGDRPSPEMDAKGGEADNSDPRREVVGIGARAGDGGSGNSASGTPSENSGEVVAPAWDRNLKTARVEAKRAGVDWKGKGLSKLVAEVKAARGKSSRDVASVPGDGSRYEIKARNDKHYITRVTPTGTRIPLGFRDSEKEALDFSVEHNAERMKEISRAGEKAAAGAKPALPRAAESSAAVPTDAQNGQQAPSAPASEQAVGQGSEAGARSSASPAGKAGSGSAGSDESKMNAATFQAKKERDALSKTVKSHTLPGNKGAAKPLAQVEVAELANGKFVYRSEHMTGQQGHGFPWSRDELDTEAEALAAAISNVRQQASKVPRILEWLDGLDANPNSGGGKADRAAPRAGKNTVFTADAADAARKLLKSKLGQLNSGIDPEMMQAGITLAGYHIEKGARTFAAYGRAMVADLGDVVKPYLKSWYMGVKYDPRAAVFDGMDSAAAVEAADVDQLQDQRSNAAGREAVDAAEDPQAEIARLRAELSAARAEADTDSLTTTRSREAYRRDHRAAKGVVFIDLVAFKGYNTKFTETGGDQILAEFGRVMVEVGGSAAYRRGGDEFALLSDQSPAHAGEIADRLRAAMAKVIIEMTDKNGDAYEVRGIPFRIGVGATDGQAVADNARRKEAGDREDNPNAQRKRTDQNDVGAASPGSVGGNENQPGAVAPTESEQGKNYREWLAKNPMPPGMRDVINMDTRLNDGEAEAIIAKATAKQKAQEASPNGTDSNPAGSPADGAQGTPGAVAGAVRADEGSGGSPDLFGPAGTVDPGADRGTRRPRTGAAKAGLTDGKSTGNSGDSRRSDRAGVGGHAVDGKPGSRNYSVPAGGLTREGSWLESAQRNVDAMALALRLESEGRLATADEQAILSKYVGFGSTEVANKLFPTSAGSGTKYDPDMITSPAWRKVGEQLKNTLTAEQLDTLMKSTQYAHFTPEVVTRGIWSALQRMGFARGRVFEPGMGHGNFPMTAPAEIKDAIAYTGLEMDHLTALIGRQLVQGGLVLRADYTKQKLPNDSFDIAVGNPPFSQTVITTDPDYRKERLMLHDYFFAKTIDKVRPGGLLSFVTSAGTMNKGSEKARQYIADRADLLGAVRLPATAFLQNAGTETVTDILFLRKRMEGEAPDGEAWMTLEDVPANSETGDAATTLVNEYFARHPEMVLGEHELIGGRYSDKTYSVSLREGETLEDLLPKALQRLPADVYQAAEVRRDRALSTATAEVDLSPDNRKEGGLYVKDGRVMVTRSGAGRELASVERLSPRENAWLVDAIGLRDTLKTTLAHQRADDPAWKQSLAELEAGYNAFAAKHGAINEFTESERVVRYYVNEIGDEVALKEGQSAPGDYEEQERTLTSRRYKNKRLLALDVESPLLMALEVETDDGRMVGAKQLRERSISPPAEPVIESTTDALLVSLNRLGYLNIEAVAELAGTDAEQVIEELGDRIYQNPIDGSWTMADAYLSGDVVTALEEAEAAARIDPAYNRNVDALRAVQPQKLLPRDITISLGATWLDGPLINDFAREVLAIPRFKTEYDQNSGQWKNNASRALSERMGDNEYGHPARSAGEILDAVLNNRELKVVVTVKGEGGKKSTQTDVAATTAVNEIAKRMRQRFSTWVWENPDRAEALAARYNSLRNRTIPRTFNGDFIDPPGLSIMFRPDSNGRGGLHAPQKRAIWRQVQTGDTYLAHAVGAGKTLEMIIGGMEQKRLGLISKPMYTVPNHVLGQFSSEFLEAYPTANIMVADEDSFTGDRRRQFIAQATVNAPDAIIISHSAFRLLRARPETMEAVVADMVADLEAAIEDTDSDDRISRKKLEQQLEALRQKAATKTDAEKQDDVVYFEDIGADFLYVDEAHEFRKLDFATNRQNVKGISPQGSAKALDLYAKIRYLHGQRPGRSHVLASGTPITNTMGEMFNVQKVMDYDGLRAAGLHHFDAWASEYGEVVTEYERNAAGQYRPVERFSRFHNIPELMQQVLERMDVLTSSQLGGFVKRPDVEGRGPQMVVVPPSPALLEYMQTFLAGRIEKSLAWKPSKAEPHNPDPMLAIIGDARLAVIDMRFVDPTAPSDPNSKLNMMIDAIAQRHQEFADTVFPGLHGPGATQIVFSPIGFGEGVAKRRGFDARAWMLKRLLEQGVPRDQIAFMSDYKNNRKRKALFREMRAARVRILVGSPANMGTGVNVQNRLRSLHYLTPPWYPSDVEQPHGRILRQGNLNQLVDLNWYVTEGTYDATGWGMVARKGKFIEQIFQADRSLRSAEDISEVSQYALASALASGDERAIRVSELEADVGRLGNLRRDHESGISAAMNSLFYARNKAERAQRNLTAAEKAVPLVTEPLTAETFGISVAGKKVPGETRTEIALNYATRLRQAIPGAARLAVGNGFEQEIGQVAGRFPIVVTARPGGGSKVYIGLSVMVGELSRKIYQDMDVAQLPANDTSALGMSTRIINAINGVPDLPAQYAAELSDANAEMERERRRAQAPFPQERELFEKNAELARLQAEMAAGGDSAKPSTEGDAEPAAVVEEQVAEPAMSRPEERPRDPRQFIVGPNDLRRRVERTMAKWRGDIPTVRVVESARELPPVARRETGWEKAEGWYDGRSTIYLVSNNIANLTRGDQVLAHEAFGHYGVEGVVGKEVWTRLIADVAKMRKDPSKLKADMRAALASTERRYGDQNSATFTREFLAVMAERGIQSGTLGRVLAAVRSWLRAMGWNIGLWSTAEVREVVARGARRVSEGGEGPRPGSGRGAAMSTPDGDQTKTPAFKRWFGGSKVVDANGEPLVVYHGTTGKAFTTYDTSYSGKRTDFGNVGVGIYTTPAKFVANAYAGAAGSTMPLYMSVENPLRITYDETFKDRVANAAQRIGVDVAPQWKGAGVANREFSEQFTSKAQDAGYDGVLTLGTDGSIIEAVAFRSEQIKSATGNRGTFDPSDPRMAFSLRDTNPEGVVASIAGRFKEPGAGVLDRLKGKLEDWKPATLGLLTLRQLSEISVRYLPEGDAYVDLTTSMATRRNVLTNEGAEHAQRWEKMQRADRRASTALAKQQRTTASDRTVDLMHDTTINGVDAAEAFRPGVIRLMHNGDAVGLDEMTAEAAISRIEAKLADKAWAKTAPDAIQNTMRGDIARLRSGIKTEKARIAAYPALVQRFKALPPEWQQLYRDVRDAYAKRAEQTLDAMLGKIEGLEIDEREKKALRDRVRAHYESARVEGPYFPLARFGEFWASVERTGADGEAERQFIMAETQRDRDRMIRQAEGEGWKLAKKGRKIENIRAQDGASGAFVADVINTLGVAGVGEKVQDEIYQLYLRTLPDLSTRKQFIHRKKVAGYDADALRAFAGQMNHGAHQLARLEFGQRLGDAITAIEKQAVALQNEAGDDADRASAAANEFKRRHEWVMNPTGAEWVSKVSAFNYVFYLGLSPAAAAVNLSQTAIISFPALAARYGWRKALAETTKAMQQSIRTRGGSMEKALATDDERLAYRQLVDMGAIDVTQAHDLAGLGDNPTQDYNAVRQRAMNVVSFLFHKAEVFNREGTGLAAYRLARGAGESHDAALKRAADTIWQTHYDYSNANRARFMQGNAAKILFAFKQYSQNTTYYLWRAFYESMKGETPEVKRIARQRLLGTMGMTAVFSGSLGLPLVSMVFGMANLMAALFGDDDEPWDAETEFRNFLADMLPPDIARIVSGGLVEGGLEAAGLPAPEIGSRTSLNDLWFRAPNQEMEGRDLWHYILEQVAGPVGGIFGGAMSGASLIGEGLATGNDGHIWRGFESMMPKAVRDGMKSLRYSTQGVNTLRGDPLIEDAGVIEGIYQALGFMPAEVSEQYELNSAVKGYEDAVGARKKVLLDAYAIATVERDPEAIRAAVLKVHDFNRAHPTAAISVSTLRRTLKSRASFSEQAVNGISVSPKLRREIDQKIRFGDEEEED